MILVILVLLILPLTVLTAEKYRWTKKTSNSWPKAIDVEALKLLLTNGIVAQIGDTNYNPYTWSRRQGIPKPFIIIHAKTELDIIETLKFVKKWNIRLTVQSTGHQQDVRSLVDDCVLLDMSDFTKKSIDVENKTLTTGPGNRFGVLQTFVYKTTKENPEPLILSTGCDRGVGPVGWSTGGGHGYLTRLYGLGSDSLISVKMIMADYRVETISADNNPDLLWALKGGIAGSFGVVVEIKMKLYQMPKGGVKTYKGLYKTKSNGGTMDLEEFSNRVANFLNQDNGYISLIMEAANFRNSYIPGISINAFCFGDKVINDCKKILSVFEKNCDGNCKWGDIVDAGTLLTNLPNDNGGVKISQAMSGTTKETLKKAIYEASNYALTANKDDEIISCLLIGLYGVKTMTNDPTGNLTAISPNYRKNAGSIVCSTIWWDPVTAEGAKIRVRKLEDKIESTLKPLAPGGFTYWSESQHNFKNNDWKERYWTLPVYNKLLEVKKKYDPDNLFTCYHCVGWDQDDSIDPDLCDSSLCTCTNNPFFANVTCSNKESRYISLRVLKLGLSLLIMFVLFR